MRFVVGGAVLCDTDQCRGQTHGELVVEVKLRARSVPGSGWPGRFEPVELRFPMQDRPAAPPFRGWTVVEGVVRCPDCENALWRTCSQCDGQAVTGPDGVACSCARYGRAGLERRTP